MAQSKTLTLPCAALEFYPPMQGLEGKFNTFRLGLAWSKRVKKGDYVLMIDNKIKIAFARARVTGVHTGTLCEMAKLYAHLNHNQRHDPDNARQAIVIALIKRYGPQMVTVDKKVTVIDLRRLKRG